MPIIWSKVINEETRLAVWKIEESEEELKGLLVLNPQEISFVQGFGSSLRALQWLASRVLLRKLLNANDTEWLDIQVDEHDKPFIQNKKYHFSISHSKDYVAVMGSRIHWVGCDIELIHPKIRKVERKFLSDIERKFIDSQSPIPHLFACWSAKEAVYKLNGKKGVSLKDHIQIQPFAIHFWGEIQLVLSSEGVMNHHMAKYEIFEGYMLAYTWK